ncbi:hypothetical protein PoB_001015400 [Plakobranchus ocellatus]|uniref:Uncharacterized protein n=1 Tax=Plakobranchus ocellatus TaxID=259542 RepID=A0AAV3YNP9_9GAST|nr:hypothetical protein PoB_001015400 [Plakobranchus ocellatus]
MTSRVASSVGLRLVLGNRVMASRGLQGNKATENNLISGFQASDRWRARTHDIKDPADLKGGEFVIMPLMLQFTPKTKCDASLHGNILKRMPTEKKQNDNPKVAYVSITLHSKVISCHETLRQATVFKPSTEGSLQISGRIFYPLCHCGDAQTL